MASFSSSLLVLFLVALFLTPQLGFADTKDATTEKYDLGGYHSPVYKHKPAPYYKHKPPYKSPYKKPPYKKPPYGKHPPTEDDTRV